MDRVYILLFVIALSVIGFLKILRMHGDTKKRLGFSHEFIDSLNAYITSRGSDVNAYVWLIKNSNQMQNQMGSHGKMAMFRPPFQNVQYSNYPIILNMLPELRNLYGDQFLSGTTRIIDLPRQYETALLEAMIRYIGTLENYENERKPDLRNPFIWIREGIRTIVAFPISFMMWIGLISKHTLDRITGSIIFKTFSALITAISLLSGVITIALGWKQFIQLIRPLLQILNK